MKRYVALELIEPKESTERYYKVDGYCMDGVVDEDETLTFQDILKQELKDGSLKGLREELRIFIDANVADVEVGCPYKSAQEIADAVIALLSKEVE